MDGSLHPLRDRGLIPAAAPRTRAKRDRGRGTFDLQPPEQKVPAARDEDEESRAEDNLPIGQAPYTEAGKRLDVTA